MCTFLKFTKAKRVPKNTAEKIPTQSKPKNPPKMPQEEKIHIHNSTNKHGLRIGFIVGHTKLRPGAKGYQLYAENHYHRIIADKFLQDYDVYYHDSYNLGYTSMCKRTAKRVAKNGKYDLLFALHFNAAASKEANGSEVLHYFSNELAKKIGKIYLMKICRRFKTTNRGLRALFNKKQRGFGEVASFDDTVVLLEPYFCSNLAETRKFTPNAYGEFLKNFVDNLYI